MIVKVDKKFDTLEKLQQELGKNKDYSYKIKRDRWSDELFATKKCIVVKETASCGAKVRFIEPNMVEVLAITPSPWIPQKGIIGYFVHQLIEKGRVRVVKNTIHNLNNINLGKNEV